MEWGFFTDGGLLLFYYEFSMNGFEICITVS